MKGERKVEMKKAFRELQVKLRIFGQLIKKQIAQHAIVVHILKNKCEILILTETWLNHQLPHVYQEYKSL